MTSLAHFLHAFRGVVVALVVLLAGASVTGPSAETVSMAPSAPVLGAAAGTGFGGIGFGGTGLAAGSGRAGLRSTPSSSSGSSHSSHSTAGAWRESSRRAPVGVEATKVEVDAERDDAPDDSRADGLGALALVGTSPTFDAPLRPALPSLSVSSLAAPYFEKCRPRGPPVG